jgi:hypothetical protein
MNGNTGHQYYLVKSHFDNTLNQLKEGCRLSEPVYLFTNRPQETFILIDAQRNRRKLYWSITNTQRRWIIREIQSYQ